MVAASLTAVIPAWSAPVEAAGWTTPTQPPTCTDAQVTAGAMTNCLLRESGSPADRGFGLPPDPAVSPGFTFGGWSYSGPSERAWATEFISANQTTVAGRGPGSLQFHVAAQAVFEGFLDEITSQGYQVSSAGGYIFRCTSSSSGSCTNGSLSNHLWGLAADINPGTNPERTYGRIDGATACATPMVTDIPEWVVESAQRWGLYWAGYGYSSGGCKSPSSESDSVRRDPHHFEFHGTAEQAIAIATRNGRLTGPMECYDTVSSRGRDVLSCNRTGVPSAYARVPAAVSPPRGATAVLVNVTAANASNPGFLVAEPCGSISEPRTRPTSNTNFDAGAAANLALVPVSRSTDQICVFRSTAVHSIVDVVGYIVDQDENSAALLFAPITPRRASDTRSGGSCTPGADCQPGQVPVGGAHQVAGVDSAALVNVTVADPRAPGYVTADRCSALTPGLVPATSTVNYGAGGARANATFVNPDTSGLCAYSDSQADVIVDVSGVLSSSGLGVVAAPARRVLDTRSVCETPGCATVAAGSVTKVAGALGRSGSAVVNVTVTQPAAAGFVAVGDCTQLTPQVTPATSTTNFATGETVANLAFVTASTADLCLYSSAAAHLVVDVQATLSDTSEHGFIVGAPTRASDTRN